MSVNSKMTAIADAIRAKTGGTGLLTLDAMPAAIASIKGGGDTATLTVNSMGGMVEFIDSDGVHRVVDIYETGTFTVAVPTIVCAHEGFNSYAEGSATTLAAAAIVGVFLVTGDATIYGEGDTL